MNRYTSAGKEVLRDGRHFADACSQEDAATIATAMNAGLADVSIELRECPTCKRLGDHEAECVERPKAWLICDKCGVHYQPHYGHVACGIEGTGADGWKRPKPKEWDTIGVVCAKCELPVRACACLDAKAADDAWRYLRP